MAVPGLSGSVGQETRPAGGSNRMVGGLQVGHEPLGRGQQDVMGEIFRLTSILDQGAQAASSGVGEQQHTAQVSAVGLESGHAGVVGRGRVIGHGAAAGNEGGGGRGRLGVGVTVGGQQGSSVVGGGGGGARSAIRGTPDSVLFPQVSGDAAVAVCQEARREVPQRTGPGQEALPPAASGAGLRAPPCRAWLVGHSYVHWAAIHALNRPGGQQLGFRPDAVSIRWLGKRGMLWSDLPGRLEEAFLRWGRPSLIVLHLGGNDVGSLPVLELVKIIQSDVRWLKVRFPGVRVAWSNVIALLQWRHVRVHRSAYRIRKKLNRDVGRLIVEEGGFVIRHDNILGDCKRLYRPDGVHLTEEGLELFFANLAGALRRHVS
ncbi:POU domain, class 4, transcription factor 1-like [Bombina bombina]|uniref:POU domain, class 4, transcription factor 1-like n=1 Tax=Bombina bombina TaxID=8345 RepID=UPI00235A9143|nr:POU domain, class 4, transcription factor 1-like [Bombina bombina]